MTRGTDTGTETMPRTPRQAPGRPVPPGGPLPPARPVPPGRTVPPGRGVPPARRVPPDRTGDSPAWTVPVGRTVPPGRTMPPRRAESPRRAEPARRAEPPNARKPGPSDVKPSRRAGRARANPDVPGRAGPGSPDPGRRPFTAPRHTRPVAGSQATPALRRPARSPDGLRPRTRHPRAPFILLLVGLLGGALISLLMISTTLAEGSFRISNLQQQDTNLARQEQVLSQQVAQAESPAQIAQEAEQFGMQQNPNLKFINLKTGKIVSGKVTQADAQINVPGYTP